jgi:hypothetical protein
MAQPWRRPLFVRLLEGRPVDNAEDQLYVLGGRRSLEHVSELHSRYI